MIIISAGLPKTASTLIATYLEKMLALSAENSGQKQLYKAYNGRYIRSLHLLNLVKLLMLSRRHGTVVVKTHYRLSLPLRLLINSGRAKAVYSYRDPRDIVLSAIDHGKRSREKGDAALPFYHCTNVRSTIPYIQNALKYALKWTAFSKVHLIRYEDLMQNPEVVVRKASEYFGWDMPATEIAQLIEQQLAQKEKSHNFNKGSIDRYKSEMAGADIEACNQSFRKFLLKHNYPVD